MVTIVPYQSTWADEFQSLGGVLRQSLGDLALRIDHIGSTSIPSLAAKDRIDIQVTVESLDPAIEGALSHIGYQKIEHLTDHAPIGIESQAREWISGCSSLPPVNAAQICMSGEPINAMHSSSMIIYAPI